MRFVRVPISRRSSLLDHILTTWRCAEHGVTSTDCSQLVARSGPRGRGVGSRRGFCPRDYGGHRRADSKAARGDRYFAWAFVSRPTNFLVNSIRWSIAVKNKLFSGFRLASRSSLICDFEEHDTFLPRNCSINRSAHARARSPRSRSSGIEVAFVARHLRKTPRMARSKFGDGNGPSRSISFLCSRKSTASKKGGSTGSNHGKNRRGSRPQSALISRGTRHAAIEGR